MQEKDPHRILGVKKGADPAAVIAAFRRLAHELHPDHNPHDPQAAENFRRVHDAYDQLRRGNVDTTSNPSEGATTAPEKERPIEDLIAAFNKKQDSRIPEQLLALVQAQPGLARTLIQDLTGKALADFFADSLRVALIALQPEAYAQKMVPYLIGAFNETQVSRFPEQLLALVQAQPGLARALIQGLTGKALADFYADSLRVALIKLQPEAYAQKMVPYLIGAFNKK